ncbi:MAG: nitrilase-related carbon-nitrogen hydrolase, partial [Bacteroidota bacterium]
MDMGPQGTWSNVAYTQFSIKPLMQLTALTGLYGINFLMLWLAAAVNQWYETRSTQQTVSVSLYTMPMVLVLVGIFGVVRLQTSSTPKSTVGVATITMDNLSVHQEMYRATFDKTLEMPEVISQSDPIVVELNKGMMAFMADPQAARYAGVYERMDEVMAKYLDESRKAAAEGAKIITWSEAAIINLKGREEAYTEAVATLADELDIYLFFPTAVFHAEKVGKEELFLENKVLTYGPEGQLLNTYFKNIPVMGVEPSFPGDGTIPVIATPYGQLSPIICYDADHPNLMAQVSNSGTDMLVVPTGDWKAISPYHTYMAAVRCIENGVSMLKATSNGLSALIDDRGRLLEQYDYFDDAPVKRIVAQMPIRSSNTMYATLAPGFIQLLMLLGAGLMVLSIARSNGRRRKPVLQQYPA